MNTTTMTREKIFFYCAPKSGMSPLWDNGGALDRKVTAMVSEGVLERRERTVHIPAMPLPEHARSMGLNPDAHDATIVTYHLTDAGRAAWHAQT